MKFVLLSDEKINFFGKIQVLRKILSQTDLNFHFCIFSWNKNFIQRVRIIFALSQAKKILFSMLYDIKRLHDVIIFYVLLSNIVGSPSVANQAILLNACYHIETLDYENM